MLHDWLNDLEFLWKALFVGLLLLGIVIGCGGLWLVQWLIGSLSTGIR